MTVDRTLVTDIKGLVMRHQGWCDYGSSHHPLVARPLKQDTGEGITHTCDLSDGAEDLQLLRVNGRDVLVIIPAWKEQCERYYDNDDHQAFLQMYVS